MGNLNFGSLGPDCLGCVITSFFGGRCWCAGDCTGHGRRMLSLVVVLCRCARAGGRH